MSANAFFRIIHDPLEKEGSQWRVIHTVSGASLEVSDLELHIGVGHTASATVTLPYVSVHVDPGYIERNKGRAE